MERNGRGKGDNLARRARQVDRRLTVGQFSVLIAVQHALIGQT